MGDSNKLMIRRSSAGVLIFIVVIAALFVLMPRIQFLRYSGRAVRCVSNLKQIGLALQNYQDKYGSLPPRYLADKSGTPLLSWRVLLLPYLERDDLYRQIRLDETWDSPHNRRVAALMPTVYRCPSDTHANIGETNYVAVTGPETVWPDSESSRLSWTPGFSQTNYELACTIIVVEIAGSGISWMEPRDLPLEEAVTARGIASKSSIAYPHPFMRVNGPIDDGDGANSRAKVSTSDRGTNCLFADGSVDIVPEAVSPKAMRVLMTVQGKARTIPNSDDDKPDNPGTNADSAPDNEPSE